MTRSAAAPADVPCEVLMPPRLLTRFRRGLASTACRAAGAFGVIVVLASASSAQPCDGDCNGDGEVTVGEIVVGVNMALGLLAPARCPNFDRNRNDSIEIDELVRAVNIALSGCEIAPSPSRTARTEPTLPPTPTPTRKRVTPKPTATTSCSSLEPPASFGAGFVDLTGDVEAGLTPVATPLPNAPPWNTFAFFNDVDGDGVMEVMLGREGPPTQLVLLRYNPSTEKLEPDAAASLPTFDTFLGVIDVDSDGIADLLGNSNSRPRVAWGRGGGVFDDPADVFPEPASGVFYASPYFDDFDGDGLLDLLIDDTTGCGGSERTVRVLFSEGKRHWSRRPDVIPTDLRLGDGVLFTAPLAGVDQTAVVLGQECQAPGQPAPRFFVPSGRDESGRPVWTPSRVVVPRPSRVNLDPIAAPMGAAIGDLDGDGEFEFSISGDVLAFWQGAAIAPLADVTERTNMHTKIGQNGPPLIPWAVLFVDLDRDGRLDTFVTHGDDYLAQELQNIGPQWSTAYWNAGGLCGIEISESLNITRRGDWKSLAVGDLEGDGLPDLAVGGHGEHPRILHNRIDTGNQGFGLRLRGTTSNVYGIGARIDVTVTPGSDVQHRFVGGFYPPKTSVEPLVFVGLGKASAAHTVRIAWPSGTVQELHDVRAGALHLVDEPASITVEPASRHLAAGAANVATVRVAPRDPSGAVRADARVDVAVVTGAARLAEQAAWNGSEWRAQIAPAAAAGSSLIEVKVDGKALPIRPRLWFD